MNSLGSVIFAILTSLFAGESFPTDTPTSRTEKSGTVEQNEAAPKISESEAKIVKSADQLMPEGVVE